METINSSSKDNRHKIDWKQLEELCLELSIYIKPKYDSLYPIAKNGLYIAYFLEKMTNIPIRFELSKNSLIIDDIIDSGRTLKPYTQDKAVIYAKNGNHKKVNYFVEKTDKYIVFPWEKDNDIEDAIIRQLEYIGEDPTREGLSETPKRVVKSWSKLFGGYNQDPKQIIKTFKDGACNEMVILKDIEFYSTCEHHLLPFFGSINIGYIPDGQVIGVSKLARIVELYSRRLQLQERLCSQIADLLEKALKPKGVIVVAEAQHFCMTARGVEKQKSKMITSALRGVFDDIKPREEFLSLIK